MPKTSKNTYFAAYMMESGAFDILEEFTAENDVMAEYYINRNYDGDWYILDEKRNNINA
jgi:hypothetical protein